LCTSLLALNMATKILTAILFRSKLFPNFWSNNIWKVDFSWNKVLRADSTGPANGMRSEKVWEPSLQTLQETDTKTTAITIGIGKTYYALLGGFEWLRGILQITNEGTATSTFTFIL